MLKEIKAAGGWIKSVWLIGSNLVKIIKGQEEIKQRLDGIEQTIKSPQYQVAELEKIKMTIDLMKENNEQEKIKLQRGSQEEIIKHKEKIEELTRSNKELVEYKDLVEKAIEVIEEKDLQIKELNAKINELTERVPSALSLALGGKLGESQSRNWFQDIIRLHYEKNTQGTL